MNPSPSTDTMDTAEAGHAADAARPVIIATLSGMAAVFMWGLAPVATRAAVAQLAPLPLTVLRAMMAGLACLPWCVSGLRRLDRAGALRAIAAGLLGMVGYNLPVALGVQWLPASTAALVLATEPVWILTLARLFLGRRTPRRAWIGSAVSLGGVAVIAGPEAVPSGSGARPLEGLGLVLLGTLLFGAYTIVLRPLSTLHGPRTATAISTTIGAVPYLALVGTLAPHRLAALPPGAWGELIFLAVGTSVVGMLMWNLSVARIGSTRAGLLLFLEPLVGVTGSLALLGEHLTPASVTGGALVMTGVVTAWIAQRRAGQA
ncbi:DMT family transporter [Actinoallomurus rhizosphaericola]|uniref:DMT family transporter n=1 Tax=Actinoallomurus rhizosphaericola TaxID=2952536 RepID=UPI0020925499|nr:DMT family transporter [Actinoallomurus rhizosphaericola]MCO5997808.1 DMT family transporter [Actinoallomurus rhizosphaericola]